MKTSSSFLLTLLLFAGQLHAGGGGGNDQGYNTEEFKYQTRPDPTRERFFGCIGTTGLKVRVYPGVVLKVEAMMPGSPCEGKFAKQEILTGINGTDLKGLDPFVAMGNALTKAEATDGKMVFDVTSADGKTQRKESVTIPVLGAYSKTWPLDCPKSKRIVEEAAAFYSNPEKFNQDGIPGALACLFLLSTGDDKYLMKEKPDLFRKSMDRLTWWHDLSREPGGSIGIATLDFYGSAVGHSGPGMGLSYTAPLRTLRITGAPRTKFSQKYTLPENLWGTEADLAFLSIEHNPKYLTYGPEDLPINRAWTAETAEPQKVLPLAGKVFKVVGRTAFVMLPAAENLHPNRPIPWVWYAPALPDLPEARENWMFERFLEAGIAVAGVDVGESHGSPQGRAHFTALYQELIGKRGFSRKPVLLPRSRGGLMLYNWAAEHPDSVGGIAGIYPVGNLRSWPGLDQACGAYGLTAAQLEEQLAQHNPIDRLAPLAKAGVPIFHIHGNADDVVPLKDNSALLASRYRELGGSMRLRIPPGQGHNVWDGFFQCQELVEFVIAHASPAASREPTAALFRDPPMEARPGAFWAWMNGDVDLDRITYELEEMKAKGMSGAEIWDIGVIHTHPEEKVPAGPAFLGPESLKAVNHAIEQTDRLGLHLGMVASSSWNAGGSWVKPQESMKGIYHSDFTVQGPASLSQVLPFPEVPHAPKGEDGLPIYYREIAVLAFPEVKSNTIADVSSVINLSSKMDSKGRLTWEVPAGTWVIQRFVNSMTGETLMVPSPNSNGLLIDHLDANAARSHFQHIIDQILTMRPSLDAMRYMEVDSVEIGRDTSQDWTDTFVEEFRKRRGYDPIPYLPALKGKSFSDPLLTSRFRQDYRKTVSDLWIDGHYRASTKFLNSYGMQLVAEGGHGGYPRVEPLKAMGVVDIPRGEFWNGEQFWVMKEAASAAHIYGLQVVDCESFTGWRSWQDGPLEYKRLADTAFCDGLNRITFHTFAHTPPSGGVPGNMYHAGEHFNVNVTWWHQSGPMLAYFSRCCYLLQQGLPVGDACYYYGDVAPNLVATRRIGPDSKRLDGAICAHCDRPNPAPVDALGSGYDYDVIDSDVIRDRLEVKDGRLVLPHGVSYEALVLPPNNEEMPLPVLAKLEKLVLEGATVLGPRPTRTPSLADSSNSDEKVREITGRLWGAVTDAPPQDKVVGKGRIIPDRNRIREVLQKKGLGPDFSYTSPGTPADLDYIHRRTLNSDIYFVSNTQMTDADAECTFRVHGRKPQFWHPDTGEITPCTGYTRVAGGMKLRVRLPPAGSVFVVFSGAVTADLPEPLVKVEGKPVQPHEITGPWEVRFPPNRGAPESCTLDKLVSWTEVPDDGIKYFSGTATYLKSFEVSEAWSKGDLRVELSLGELRNVAEVTVNGKPLGILWKPPYKVDVTGLLKPGKNELKIDITNLWANRIAGDEKLPRERRVTRITQKLPVPGPHPSGLFGPVQLLLAQ